MKKQLLFFLTAILFFAFTTMQDINAQTNTATGVQALQFNTTGTNNTATGLRALQFNTTGSFNSAHGTNALRFNTTGAFNTAVGYNTLTSNTTGVGNAAIGQNALASNTTGSGNTATGGRALFANTTGFSNTANGVVALESNTTGSNNTATGYFSLSRNTTGSLNTAIGHSALNFNTTGSRNTAIGNAALISNTTGDSNTATGVNALFFNTTGSFNTANGISALRQNTTGAYNTANGVAALLINTIGTYNTATGVNALHDNTIGNYNTGNGVAALFSNTAGEQNTASGVGALRLNTTGSFNTATGVDALRSNTTGSFNSAYGANALRLNAIGSIGNLNTAVGHSALFETIGDRNTAIGTNAGVGHPFILQGTFLGSSTGHALPPFPAPGFFVNVTAIGYQARTTGSNQVRIGNSAVTSIGGQVNWTVLSDGRYKKNLKEDVPGLEFINKLRPVTYTLDITGMDRAMQVSDGDSEASKAMAKQTPEEAKAKAEKAKVKYTGFVAQEVEEAAKKLNYDFSGVDAPKNKEDFYGLRYSEFVVPLVKSVQELDAENNQLKKEMEKQQQQINELKEMVAKLINGKSLTTNGANNVTVSGAYLEQNAPNPFNGNTIIRYHLPQGAVDAKIVINNMKGQLLKTIALNSQGDGHITLQAGTLPAGSYTYSLWVKAKQVDAKQMLVK